MAVGFRANTLSEAGLLFSRMFSLTRGSVPLAEVVTRTELSALLLAVPFCLPALPRRLGRWLAVIGERPWPEPVTPPAYLVGALVGALVFVAVATKVLTGAYSPFIYFRF